MTSLVRKPVVLLVGPLVAAGLVWGQAGRGAPKRYDPDPQACQMETIRQTFRANLLPWSDQPPAAQQQLRQLQAAMTLDTLRECQAKGLLNPDQVRALEQELGLPTPTPTPGGAQSPVRP